MMRKLLNVLFGDSNKREEEYKRALWEHEQIGYRLYSIGVAIKEL